MNLFDFSLRILNSTDIEDKLAHPGRISFDQKEYKGALPELPNRSSEFSFGRKKAKEIPNGELRSDRDRGLMLLFFMNHELMAVELMALSLLRFSHCTSESFQRGLYQTLIDEQKHCRLYLNRFKELGCKAGEIPLSRFFWDCLANAKSPDAYLCGMSLTLEQANLDFTKYYHQVFKNAGDDKSAKILNTVYQDEIRHVQFGLDFIKQKRGSQELWSYYKTHLPEALNPARAKAKMFFDLSGRKIAGMNDDEIIQFKTFNSSRGRSPNVWSFNPAAELESVGIEPKKMYQQIENDLCPLMVAITRQDDILIADNISKTNLEILQDIGLSLPEVVAKKDICLISQKHRPGQFRPWGLSPVQRDLFNPLLKFQSKKFNYPLWDSGWAKLYSKAYQSEYLASLKNNRSEFDLSSPKICNEITDLNSFKDGTELIIKIPRATTGRSCRKIIIGEISESDKGWIKGALKRQKQFTTEPYRERLADFSAQYELSPNGDLKFIGITMIRTDKFANIANICGPFQKNLNVEMKKFIFKNKENLLKSGFDLIAKRWHEEMYKIGFHGPFGLDGFIWKDANHLKFRPLCELNPRLTMGRIALELNRICKRGLISELSFQPVSKIKTKLNNFSKDKDGRLESAHLNLTPDAKNIAAFFKILQ